MALTIQNVEMFITDTGAGSPILFLHGAPDTGEMWSGLIAQLKGEHRCIAPDLPGFGRSRAPKGFVCSLENMAQFVDELVEGYGIPTPLDLVVADFGATYGLAWAAAHPEKVRRLAIVGGSNFTSRYQWHGDARMLRTPVLGELGMAGLSESFFVKKMSQNAPLLSAEHVRTVYKRSLAKGTGGRQMMLKLYRSIDPEDFKGWEERLHELTARIPALVLWGDKDPFITPDYAESFGAKRVEHFPENGHWLAVEAPEVVGPRLRDFLA